MTFIERTFEERDMESTGCESQLRKNNKKWDRKQLQIQIGREEQTTIAKRNNRGDN